MTQFKAGDFVKIEGKLFNADDFNDKLGLYLGQDVNKNGRHLIFDKNGGYTNCDPDGNYDEIQVLKHATPKTKYEDSTLFKILNKISIFFTGKEYERYYKMYRYSYKLPNSDKYILSKKYYYDLEHFFHNNRQLLTIYKVQQSEIKVKCKKNIEDRKYESGND